MSMSFAAKTRAQVAKFNQQKALALEAYPLQFLAFAKVALGAYDSKFTAKQWADSYATSFVSLVNTYVTHAEVSADLYKYHVANYAPSPPRVTRYHLARPASAAASASASAPASATQETEERLQEGKAQFNRILRREYETWYPAFDAEAQEDEDGPSADTRWIYHSAKNLSKRTGLTTDSLMPIVEAWLDEHAA